MFLDNSRGLSSKAFRRPVMIFNSFSNYILSKMSPKSSKQGEAVTKFSWIWENECVFKIENYRNTECKIFQKGFFEVCAALLPPLPILALQTNINVTMNDSYFWICSFLKISARNQILIIFPIVTSKSSKKSRLLFFIDNFIFKFLENCNFKEKSFKSFLLFAIS